MHLTLRGLRHYLTLVIFCAAFALAGIGVQSGLFPTSDYSQKSIYEPSEFMLEVEANGETIFTGVEGGSRILTEEIWEEVKGRVYPSPEAAVEAVEGPLPGNPALAHAVNICTHSDGKVSNETGGGRHITKFRFHDNGRHFTRTDHQTLTQNGYITYDTFYYDVSRSYCGCN